MSKYSHSSSLNRRQLLSGAAAFTATLPIAKALAEQTGTSTPAGSASPAASPQPTPVPPAPTPLPVPDHTLNIVRNRVDYAEPVVGGDLRLFISSRGLENANPATQVQDATLLYSVFEGLTRINPESMMAEPGLARSWKWDETGLELTFELRDDVRWHDGTTFTATDAAFTCQVYRDDYDSGAAGFFSLIDTIEPINAHTLKLTFISPDGAFVFNGASAPMLQAAMYQPLWDEFIAGEKTLSRKDLTLDTWIGTGPWRIASSDSTKIKLSRFDDYWNLPANCDTLTLLVEDDAAKRLDGWKSGVVDIVPVSAAMMPSLWRERGSLFVAPSPMAMFAAFNFHNPANVTEIMMVDPWLRAALTMAIDRDAYADDVFFGFINEHSVGTMAQPWLHDAGLSNPVYDPDGARETLAEGGWLDYDGDGIVEDGYGNKADLYLIIRQDERPELAAILKHVADDWERIGVRLTVQELAPEIFDDRWTQNRDYDLIAYSLVNYPAFNEFDLYGSSWDIRFNAHGWNPGGYYNEDVEVAIDEWFAATDPDAMRAAASAIQMFTNDDLFGLWFGFPNELILVREGVQGFNPDIFLYSQSSHYWWFGAGLPPAATPEATPVMEPVATPGS